LANQGVLLHGLEVLGGGAALSGIVLAAITVFVIEHKLRHAAAFATAGALFTLFGLMHGERVGLTPHPEVAIGYLMVAVFLAASHGREGAGGSSGHADAQPDAHGKESVG
jgi:AGZA family xanthine/uracil permease-like MFS transporter